MKLIDSESKHELMDLLEQRKLFFRTFWSVSDIFLTDNIPTACVRLINDKICFLFNPTFWEQHTIKFKLFIICHEQLHIILNHFERLRFHEGDVKNKNIAADIPINHLLIRKYDFDREQDIPNWENYCWVETIFPDQPNMPDNETTEFYYTQLKCLQPETNCQTIDNHDEVISRDDNKHNDPSLPVPQNIKDVLKETVKELTDDLSEEEMEEISKDLQTTAERQAGTGFGNGQLTVNATVKPKKSWKKLYKLIPKRILTNRLQSHWLSNERRFTLLSDNLMLPCDMEIPHGDKVVVHVYLDTSGSCKEDAEYFLQTALTLDPRYFKVQILGFSDRIYDIPSKPPYKLRGFGGTSFQAISDHVDDQTQVDAVFVFTDGYAPMAHPKDPHKWFWFVLPDGTFNCIDHRCHSYDLSQYNWR